MTDALAARLKTALVSRPRVLVTRGNRLNQTSLDQVHPSGISDAGFWARVCSSRDVEL